MTRSRGKKNEMRGKKEGLVGKGGTRFGNVREKANGKMVDGRWQN